MKVIEKTVLGFLGSRTFSHGLDPNRTFTPRHRKSSLDERLASRARRSRRDRFFGPRRRNTTTISREKLRELYACISTGRLLIVALAPCRARRSASYARCRRSSGRRHCLCGKLYMPVLNTVLIMVQCHLEVPRLVQQCHRGSVPNRPTPLFCGESRQRIDDFEPRSLEIGKDVTLRAKSGIIVERPGGYIDHVTVHRRQRSTAYRAECPSISWPGLPHWRFIGLDKRSSAEPFKLGGLEYQFGSKCGAAGLPATRAMIEVKGGRSARHFVPHCATQAASFQGIATSTVRGCI